MGLAQPKPPNISAALMHNVGPTQNLGTSEPSTHNILAMTFSEHSYFDQLPIAVRLQGQAQGWSSGSVK